MLLFFAVSLKTSIFTTLESDLTNLSRINPKDKQEKQSLEAVQKMVVDKCLTQSQHSGVTPEEVKLELQGLWQKKSHN